MKKHIMIGGALALFAVLGATYAFKANTLPGDLYYFDPCGACRKAPCATVDQTGNRCGHTPLYSDDGCSNEYGGLAWVTDGAN